MENENEIENEIEGPIYINNTKNVFISLLIGGLAGAVAMALFAPQSGKQMRTKIEKKSLQLRAMATRDLKKAVKQVRASTKSITAEVREMAGVLKQLGQDKVVEQLDRVSTVIDNGKTAIEAA